MRTMLLSGGVMLIAAISMAAMPHNSTSKIVILSCLGASWILGFVSCLEFQRTEKVKDVDQ